MTNGYCCTPVFSWQHVSSCKNDWPPCHPFCIRYHSTIFIQGDIFQGPQKSGIRLLTMSQDQDICSTAFKFVSSFQIAFFHPSHFKDNVLPFNPRDSAK